MWSNSHIAYQIGIWKLPQNSQIAREANSPSLFFCLSGYTMQIFPCIIIQCFLPKPCVRRQRTVGTNRSEDKQYLIVRRHRVSISVTWIRIKRGFASKLIWLPDTGRLQFPQWPALQRHAGKDVFTENSRCGGISIHVFSKVNSNCRANIELDAQKFSHWKKNWTAGHTVEVFYEFSSGSLSQGHARHPKSSCNRNRAPC